MMNCKLDCRVLWSGGSELSSQFVCKGEVAFGSLPLSTSLDPPSWLHPCPKAEEI